MSQEINLNTERLLMIALMKSWSEQSTYMTGSLKMELKQSLNNLVKRVDEFVILNERNLNENQKEYITSIVDIYHNYNIEIRNSLNQQYKDKIADEQSNNIQ